MRDTIDMAREAGFEVGKVFVEGMLTDAATMELKAFETLVRADEREQALATPVQERKGKEYVYTLIDSLLMPPQAMAASDLRELHRQAAQMLGLYAHTTSPAAQRQWVGLTEKEILESRSAKHLYFYKAIEAKLKEKNT